MKKQTVKPLKDNLRNKLYECAIKKDLFAKAPKALIIKKYWSLWSLYNIDLLFLKRQHKEIKKTSYKLGKDIYNK